MTDLTLRTPGAVLRAAHHDSVANEPSLLAISLWIRALFVGLSLFVAGLVTLFDPALRSNAMLALVAAGAVLTALSLQRTRTLMRAIDHRAQ